MSFSSVDNRFHARGAATENARSPNRRSVSGRKSRPSLWSYAKQCTRFLCIAGRLTCICATKPFRATTRFGMRLFLTDNEATGDEWSKESDRYMPVLRYFEWLFISAAHFLLFVHHCTSPKSTLSFVIDATSAHQTWSWVGSVLGLGWDKLYIDWCFSLDGT